MCPNGSTVDMRERIEAQIERYAPGFRDCIIARSALSPAELEQRNANLVGGDIAGGAADLAQIFARPVSLLHPYSTPIDGVYLCSSSTPPGVGVHGMCGYHAARAALAESAIGDGRWAILSEATPIARRRSPDATSFSFPSRSLSP